MRIESALILFLTAVATATIFSIILVPVKAAMIQAEIPGPNENPEYQSFWPNPILASVNDTVTWTNNDSLIHTVTSGTNATPDGKFDSSNGGKTFLAPKQTFSHTFEEPGEFPYFCMLHPNMVGTVVVSSVDHPWDFVEPFDVTIEEKQYRLWATVEIVEKISINSTDNSIVIALDETRKGTHGGTIYIDLPRNIINSSNPDGSDKEFVVLLDGKDIATVDYPTENENSRILGVQYAQGTETVKITGTQIIPEFGHIIAVVMGLAISGIIFASRFGKMVRTAA